MIDQGAAIIAGLVTGTIGSVLGLLNSINSITARTTRIKAKFVLGHEEAAGGLVEIEYPFTSAESTISDLIGNGTKIFVGVKILNKSDFPVTLEKVGFLDRLGTFKNVIHLREDLVIPKTARPYRIEARSMLLLFNTNLELSTVKDIVKYVFVKASCEPFVKFGTRHLSRIIRQLLSEGKPKQKKSDVPNDKLPK